jgi:hypothetical protein
MAIAGMMAGVMSADAQAQEAEDVAARLRRLRRTDRQGCRNRYECQPWTTHRAFLAVSSRRRPFKPIARPDIRSGTRAVTSGPTQCYRNGSDKRACIVANLSVDTKLQSVYASAANLTGEARLSRLKIVFGCAVAAAVLGFGQGGASAQGSAQEEAACRPDVMRLCRTAAPDTMRVLACLQANRSRLSRGCRAVLQAHGQ